MLIACYIAGDIYFFLAAALAWGGAAMHLRWHRFWRFSRPAPLLGKHIITEFVLVLFVSIKAAMDLLSIAILFQLMCLFLLPSKQSSGKSSIYGFCFGAERGRHKQNICLQIGFLCLLSLTRVYLIIQGGWV